MLAPDMAVNEMVLIEVVARQWTLQCEIPSGRPVGTIVRERVTGGQVKA